MRVRIIGYSFVGATLVAHGWATDAPDIPLDILPGNDLAQRIVSMIGVHGRPLVATVPFWAVMPRAK